MRKNFVLTTVFAFAILLLSGCAAIGSIFKAGMWVGVIVVVIVVALVLWLIGKMRK